MARHTSVGAPARLPGFDLGGTLPTELAKGDVPVRYLPAAQFAKGN